MFGRLGLAFSESNGTPEKRTSLKKKTLKLYYQNMEHKISHGRGYIEKYTKCTKKKNAIKYPKK